MSAKEMFEKRGFKYLESEIEIHVEKKDRQWGTKGIIDINFDLENKTIDFAFIGNESNFLPVYIDLEELQAINQQVKELGWYE